MKRTIVVLLVGAWLAIAPAAHAQEFTSTHTDCSGLELFAAAGVPDGATHKYQFRGICRELEKDGDNKVVSVRWQGWVEVDSRYDVKTAEFDEGVKITMAAGYDGPQSGTIQIRLKCTQDPMLTSSSCTIMQFAQQATWPDFVTAWKKNAPYTKGKVTYAQAAELSKLATSNPPPPPPPPPAGEQKSASRDGVALPAVQAPVSQPPAGQPKQRTTPVARPAPAPQPPPEATRLALPPLPPGATEIQLTSDAKIALQSGRALAARPVEGSLRWTILGEADEILRTFPAGSRAWRNDDSEILVDWGGGTFNAGTAKPVRLLVPR